ncbi:MAG: ATP-binding protein [Pseudomonadota bacterium]
MDFIKKLLGTNTQRFTTELYSTFRPAALIYTTYRIAMAVFLWMSWFFLGTEITTDPVRLNLYMTVSSCYLLICIFSLMPLKDRPKMLYWLTFAHLTIDILAINILSYASGGLNSQVNMLQVVSIAAGGILFAGRLATFLAAMATLAIFFQHLLITLQTGTGDFLNLSIGLLGMTFFGTSLLSQYVSRLQQSSESQAQKQAAQLQRLESLNELIIQRMQTGILLIDTRGRVILSNRSAHQMLGNPNQLLILQAHAPRLWRAYLEWNQNNQHKKVPFREKTTCPIINASFSRLTPTAEDFVIIFMDDEIKVRQQAEHLKLASLGRLAGSIAHEIRNPLGAISHAAQLLAEIEPTVEQQTLVDIMLRHSHRVNAIIENVMQVSRREIAKPSLISLSPWLEDFIRQYREQIQIDLDEHPSYIEIELKISQHFQIAFDPSHLQQVLNNLLDNGIRYSFSITGRYWSQITVDQDSDERTFIDVTDCGPGINEDVAQHIFEPFFTTESAGSGLGLYLCSEICDLNQAQLIFLKNEHRQSPSHGIFNTDIQNQSIISSIKKGAVFRIYFSHPKRSLNLPEQQQAS